MVGTQVQKFGSLRLLYKLHTGYPFLVEAIVAAVERVIQTQGLKPYGPRTLFFHFDPWRVKPSAWEARVGRAIVGYPKELGDVQMADYEYLRGLEAELMGGVDEIRRVYRFLWGQALGEGLRPREFWRINSVRETVDGTFKQKSVMQLFVV